jgi:hypothetical protein
MYNLHNLYTLQCVSWQEGAPRLLQVRQAAFGCGILSPTEVRADAMDRLCRHALALNQNGQAVGCVRITPDGKIERMAVLPGEHRDQLATALVETVLKEMLNERSRDRDAQHNLAYAKHKPQIACLAA